MDVINRGMNGYNSRWGLAALPLILEEIMGQPVPWGENLFAAGNDNDAVDDDRCIDAKKDSAASGDGSQTTIRQKEKQSTDTTGQKNNEQCLTEIQSTEKKDPQQQHPQYTFFIAYGANDSCLPDGPNARHHVPLEEYSNNLKRMVQMIQKWNVSKKVAVAVLTPPPCDTERLKGSRDNENVTKMYAEYGKKVAHQMGVPVVDLWNGMQLPIAKYEEEENLSSFVSTQQWKTDYLSDGLHLSPRGNFRLYELVIEMLDRSADDVVDDDAGLGLAVTQLPRSYPDHSQIDADDPSKTFDAIN